MQLEAQRIVAAWLADATYGVNAKLAGLTYDGSDTQPADVATITAACDHEDAAFGRFDGMTLPAIIVAPRDTQHRDAAQVQPHGEVYGSVTLLVRYAQRTTSATKALRDGAYVTRAILASLRELYLPANEASRQRNNVYLLAPEDVREPGLYEETDDAWLISAVEVTYQAFDNAALGA